MARPRRPGRDPDRGSDYLRATYSEPAEQLQRALGIQGPLPDAVDPMLTPGVTLLDMRDPEMLFLRRTNRFFSGQNLAGVAAQWPIFEFENPAASGMLMVVVATAMNPNATAILTHLAVTDQIIGGGAATRSCNADSRQAFSSGAVAPFPVAVVRAQSLAAPAPINGPVFYTPVSGGSYTHEPIVLSPGRTIRIQPNTQNTSFGAFFAWTERQIQPMESA